MADDPLRTRAPDTRSPAWPGGGWHERHAGFAESGGDMSRSESTDDYTGSHSAARRNVPVRGSWHSSACTG